MSTPGDSKQLKFTIAIDPASLEQAKRAIREITTEVSKLVAEMNKASLGGLLGGAGMRQGAGTGATAASSIRGGKAGSGGSTGNSMADGLTASLVANKNLLKGVASESKDVMRVMQDAVRTGMSTQVREVDRLRTEIKKLADSYSALGKIHGTTFGGQRIDVSSGMSEMQSEMVGKQVELQKNMGEFRTLNGMTPQRKGWGGAWDSIKQGAGGGMNLSAAGALGMLGIPGAIAGSIVAAGSLGSRLTSNYIGATSREQLLQPYDAMNKAVAYGQSAGVMGQQIRHGDQGLHMAIMAATQEDRRFKDATYGHGTNMRVLAGPESEEARQMIIKADHANPLKWLMDYKGESVSRTRALKQIDNDQMQEIRRQAEMQKQANPELYSNIDEVVGNSGSRIAAMRGLHTGYSVKTNTNSAMMMLAKLKGRGFDPGQILGMQSAIEGAGGTGIGGVGSMLGLQAGGLGNAGQLYGTAAAYGNPSTFMNALSRSAGSGGINVMAAGVMGNTAISGMGDGGAPTSGMGYLGAMGALTSGGSSADNMRMQRMMASGQGEYGRMLSGQTDQLQSGINVLSAIKAGGNLSIYGRHALEGMSPRQLADATRNNEVSGPLKNLGITPEIVHNYLQTQSSMAFSRYNPGTGKAGAPMDRFVADIQKAGGLENYYRHRLDSGEVKPVKPGSAAAIKIGQSIAQNAGQLYQLMGQASSQQGGEGRALTELSLNPNLAPSLRGSGIGDAAGGTAEMSDQQREAQRQADLEKQVGAPDVNNLLKTLSKTTKEDADLMRQFGSDVSTSAGQFVTALEKMTVAINKATGNLNGKENAAKWDAENKAAKAKPKTH